MVAFYLMRIRAEKMMLEEVPSKWHDEVAEKL
ncbi:CD1375 family protein [Lacrimispora sp.]|nr:CD1375 family protein [Lacrimispora sp.]MDR7813402.1 CD1375 family protein [Lacrimispora sp.]